MVGCGRVPGSGPAIRKVTAPSESSTPMHAETTRTDQIRPPVSEGRGSRSPRRRNLSGRSAVQGSDDRAKDAHRRALACEFETLHREMRTVSTRALMPRPPSLKSLAAQGAAVTEVERVHAQQAEIRTVTSQLLSETSQGTLIHCWKPHLGPPFLRAVVRLLER